MLVFKSRVAEGVRTRLANCNLSRRQTEFAHHLIGASSRGRDECFEGAPSAQVLAMPQSQPMQQPQRYTRDKFAITQSRSCSACSSSFAFTCFLFRPQATLLVCELRVRCMPRHRGSAALDGAA